MSPATKKRTTKAAKAPAKAPRAKAPKHEPTRSEIISAAMRELAAERTEARAARDGRPCKHVVYELFYKATNAGKQFDVDATAKRFPEVKESTVRAWVSAWHRLSNLPSNANEKLLVAALKKVK
jgi:hypothetical protein